MNKIELDDIYHQLDREINYFSKSTISSHRTLVKEDAKNVISSLKADIYNWATLLQDREITCYDLEKLLETKIKTIQLMNLEKKKVDSEILENYKADILRLIAKSIFNTFINSMFRNKTTKQNSNCDNNNVF